VPFSKGSPAGEATAVAGATPLSPAGSVSASADRSRQRSPPATRTLGERNSIF